MTWRWMFAAALLVLSVRCWGAELTEAEIKLKGILGEGTPEPIRLWEGRPPKFVENAAAETVDENARIQMISTPTISAYLPEKDRRTGMAIVVCPGGGYGGMDWRTHVVYAAKVFNPMGVAVIGLKYRTRPPYMGSNEEIRAVALLDVQRAVRLVRHHAADWGIDPKQVGVVGYSAGANLAMNLAGHFDAGKPGAEDVVERESCRPDFVVGLGTWHWRKKESPFLFSRETPPVLMIHAVTDKPVEIVETIKADLEKLGVPVKLEMFNKGGHGVGNLIPTRVAHGFPGAQWPGILLRWLKELKAAETPHL